MIILRNMKFASGCAATPSSCTNYIQYTIYLYYPEDIK